MAKRNKGYPKITAVIVVLVCIVAVVAIVRLLQHEQILFTNGATTSNTSAIKQISLLTANGGRVDWSKSGNNLIAFDRREADGYYDVYTMTSGGKNQTCITCNNPQLPNKHQGQPVWHPSGKWILFQAEKKRHPGISIGAIPGIGVFNDLWAIETATKKVYQLTNIPNNPNSGILHPHVSPDGKKVVWAEMYQKADTHIAKKEFGLWKIKIADFVESNGMPVLKNIQELQPLGEVWYETHGFSPDGQTIYVTSNASEQKLFQADIFSYNLSTKRVTRLTSSGYNEHSQISPDGKKIIWMHTDAVFSLKGTDFWIMHADGSNKQQLTFFRTRGHPQFNRDYIIAADSSWSPTSNSFVGYIQSSVLGGKENILRFDF